MDYCSNSPCLNGATCKNGTNTYNCLCQKGWTGINCDQDINECNGSPCNNDQVCVNTIGGFQCKQTGFLNSQNFTAGTLGVCDHACTIETVAKLRPVESNITDICPGTTNKATNEALLIECCYLGRSITWYKGIQVLSHCKNNTIASYTPIAAVINGQVVPDTAGVLTSCSNDGSGFQMIQQRCSASPQVLTVDGTIGVDPNSYYVMFKI
ncbi:fibropellin-1-like [Ruditapes philippinarum]|uniref:fibropellin-1-like n=1 Tax=Ruditapes philippinarum TaxID=129788 RepID=UPI00295BB291|nr:fibropellin-1-like [Ruditapes philippinarum]